MTAPTIETTPATYGQAVAGNVLAIQSPTGPSYWRVESIDPTGNFTMTMLDPSTGQPAGAPQTGPMQAAAQCHIVTATIQPGQFGAQPASVPAPSATQQAVPAQQAPATMGQAVGNVAATFPGAQVVSSQDTPTSPVQPAQTFGPGSESERLLAELRDALGAVGRILAKFGGQA